MFLKMSLNRVSINFMVKKKRLKAVVYDMKIIYYLNISVLYSTPFLILLSK